MADKEGGVDVLALIYILVYGFFSVGRQENDTDFVAFAANGDFVGILTNIITIQGDKLGDADAGREECLDDGEVSEGF